MQVLIVEDDQATGEIMKDLLQRQSTVVTVAGSCAEARNLLQASRFDVAVLDNCLPDGLGIDLVAEAGASGARVIMVTADGSFASLRRQAMALGAEAVFEKPFHVDQFLRQVFLTAAGEEREGLVAAVKRLPEGSDFTVA